MLIVMTKRSTLPFLLVFLPIIFQLNLAKAQKKELKKDAEISFELGNYKKALRLYKELYEYDTLDVTYNYRLGICYLNVNTDKSKALKHLKYVAIKEPKEEAVFFNLGLAYFHAHEFKKARQTFTHYKDFRKAKLVDKADRYIQLSYNAEELIQKKLRVKFINMGRNINDEFPNFNPFVSGDEQLLTYSSTDQDQFTDVYVSTRKRIGRSLWVQARPATRLNATYDALVAGLSTDGNLLFVHSNEFSPIKDIDVSPRIQGRFQELDNIGTNINTEYREEGATICPTKDTLYFASDKPGGFGGFDLYMSVKLPNGEWALPRNLGETINTPYNENYPFYSNDVLYFSSEGHKSMGGYDIFKTKRMYQTNQWQTPQNIGYPINNTYDNRSISFLEDQRYAYIAAYRDDSYGDLDIYKVVLEDIQPIYVVYKGEINVVDSVETRPLSDFETSTTITVYETETNEMYGIYSYNRYTGKYVISLSPGKYKLVVKSTGFKTYKTDIEIYEGPQEKMQIENNIVLEFEEQP